MKKILLFFIPVFLSIAIVSLLIQRKLISPITSLPSVIKEVDNPEISTLPAASGEPSPTPVATPAIPLFELHFNTSNYSLGEPSGDVPGVKVRLYDSQNRLLGEQVVPPIVMKGNGGSGGNVLFQVPLGTYRADAETTQLVGTKTVTLTSYKDQQFYTIPMYAQPIKISGKYYFDANKSGTYNEGETTFANKKINAFVRTGAAYKNLYEAGSTTTDSQGNFLLTVKYIGSYTFGAEQVLGYQELSQRWVDLTAGQSATYDIYLWSL